MMGPPGMGGPSPYGVDPITGMPFSDKSKVVAGLLNIFLFGAGRLYTGHIGIGIAQILTTVFCGVGYIWALIDGIMMLMGIAAKNSILLVEYALEAMKRGMSRYDALMDAAHRIAAKIAGKVSGTDVAALAARAHPVRSLE